MRLGGGNDKKKKFNIKDRRWMNIFVGIHILPYDFVPTLQPKGTKFMPYTAAIQINRCGTQHDYGYAGWCPVQSVVSNITQTKQFLENS